MLFGKEWKRHCRGVFVLDVVGCSPFSSPGCAPWPPARSTAALGPGELQAVTEINTALGTTLPLSSLICLPQEKCN